MLHKSRAGQSGDGGTPERLTIAALAQIAKIVLLRHLIQIVGVLLIVGGGYSNKKFWHTKVMHRTSSHTKNKRETRSHKVQAGRSLFSTK